MPNQFISYFIFSAKKMQTGTTEHLYSAVSFDIPHREEHFILGE